MTKPEVGHFRAQGVPLKRKLREFPVTEDALLPVGTPLHVRHFVPGQFVDVTGITKGKGFQVFTSFCSLSLSLSLCIYIPTLILLSLFFKNKYFYVLAPMPQQRQTAFLC